jgi:hypothetical protein
MATHDGPEASMISSEPKFAGFLDIGCSAYTSNDGECRPIISTLHESVLSKILCIPLEYVRIALQRVSTD